MPQAFLTNPSGKRRKKVMRKRKTTKRKRSTSTAMKRKMTKVRSFKKNGGKRTMAKKRKKRKVRTVTVYKRKTISRNPQRRKVSGKRYRRNPRIPRTARGFGNQLFNGVIDAGEVVVGKATAKMIPQMMGIPSSGPMGLLTQALVAIGVGFLGTQMISANAGKMMLAGALASPVEDMIKQMNIPFLSP